MTNRIAARQLRVLEACDRANSAVMAHVIECYTGVDGLLYVIRAAFWPGLSTPTACVWIVPSLNEWEC